VAIAMTRTAVAVAGACFAGVLAGVALAIPGAPEGWYFVSVLSLAGVATTQVIAPGSGFARSRRPTDPPIPLSVLDEADRDAARPASATRRTDLSTLWLECKRHDSPRAREQLVIAYSPLVKYVAGRMSAGLPPQVSASDLFSYGLIGLINAMERFDPEREIRFETYAITRIKGAIIDELRALDWVPKSVRARAREIERAHDALEQRLRRPPTDEEMAAELNLPVDEFLESLVTISNSTVVALDERWDTSGDRVALLDTPRVREAPDSHGERSAAEDANRLVQAVSALPEREKRVVGLYYFESLTLQEIADVLGVTEKQAAAMHSRAVLTLSKDLRSRVLEDAYEVSRDLTRQAT
jgi:RNA polymerase sigma factor for flagellar operon FliA